MKKVVLLNSGGLDSACVGKWLSEQDYEIYSLFIDVGQLCRESAMIAAQETADRFCHYHEVITVDFNRIPNFYEDNGQITMWEDREENQKGRFGTTPSQPILMPSLGITYAKMVNAWEVYGGHKQNFTDEALNLFNKMNSNIRDVRLKPQLVIPIWDITSYSDAISFAGFESPKEVEYTHSCSHGNIPCGECWKCKLRQEILI